jgi:hypothetical protein
VDEAFEALARSSFARRKPSGKLREPTCPSANGLGSGEAHRKRHARQRAGNQYEYKSGSCRGRLQRFGTDDDTNGYPRNSEDGERCPRDLETTDIAPAESTLIVLECG